MPAYYATALLIAFYALVIAEVLIPSGGLLGASALVVAVTSVIIGCTYSFEFGMMLLFIFLTTTPILFAIVIKLWPKTRIGRRMLNRDTLESESAGPIAKTIDGTPLTQMVGRVGKATSKLLPAGEVKIDGHKATAVSTGLPIDKGDWIWAVRIRAGKLQVRSATQSEVAASQGAVESPSDQPIDPTFLEPIASMSSALEGIDLDNFDIPFQSDPNETEPADNLDSKNSSR